MEEKEYEIAFQIILYASEAKNNAFEAMKKVVRNNIEEAEKCLEEAESSLQKGHQVQTDLLQTEAQGQRIQLSLILVHSQDHLTMGIFAVDMARTLIEEYKVLKYAEEV